MGGLMKGYADGLQDSRARNAESSAAAAQQEAYDADRRAARAERHAAEVIAIAASWKQEALLNQGKKDGFKALFLALYDLYVEPLQGDARDQVQRGMSAAAKSWISSKCNDDQKALIREAWRASDMQAMNQIGGLVQPLKPAPFAPPPPPRKPGEITEIRVRHWIFFKHPEWLFEGHSYIYESDVLKIRDEAIQKYEAEMKVWVQAAEAADSQYRNLLAEYESWVNKYGENY